MKPGFVTAVGTPLDASGNLCAESYKKHVNDQVNAGAIAILCMGSMGQQAFIRPGVCTEVAKAAAEAVAGRVPLYVGCMDCSIFRARERLAAMEDLPVDGFVFTTPYYASCKPDEIVNYFKAVAACTKHPVLMYDLPSVTQSKITFDVVLKLIREVPNLGGIKSADTQLHRRLLLCGEVPADFKLFYSGLDTFDVAYKWGIDKCLDGMPACTPVNTSKLFRAMEKGDYAAAAGYLNNIVWLRDAFLGWNLWPAFSTAMNMLGYEGNFAPDYVSPIDEKFIPEIRDALIRIGEL